MPWRSASALELLIFLLFILAAQSLFHLLNLLDESSERRPPTSEPSASDSGGLLASDSPSRLVGLVGRGEKVPWLQGPSWASSRRNSAVPSRAVASVGRCLLGPATV